MQIINFFYTYANFLPTIFKLSPNFIPKSLKITQFSPPPSPSENVSWMHIIEGRTAIATPLSPFKGI